MASGFKNKNFDTVDEVRSSGEAKSLIDAIKGTEKEEEVLPVKAAPSKPRAVNRILDNNMEKDKQISAKVNNKTWETFTRINKVQGLSNNSALNVIISKYVRENRGILDE